MLNKGFECPTHIFKYTIHTLDHSSDKKISTKQECMEQQSIRHRKDKVKIG